MNQESCKFIKQNWRLLFHASAEDYMPLIERSVLYSVYLIVKELEKDDYRTTAEIVEGTGLGTHTIQEITSLLRDELFEKFPCPDPEKTRREVAIKLIKQKTWGKKTSR